MFHAWLTGTCSATKIWVECTSQQQRQRTMFFSWAQAGDTSAGDQVQKGTQTLVTDKDLNIWNTLELLLDALCEDLRRAIRNGIGETKRVHAVGVIILAGSSASCPIKHWARLQTDSSSYLQFEPSFELPHKWHRSPIPWIVPRGW